MNRLGLFAWILIFIVDAAYLAWGAGAAVTPGQLLGPGCRPIQVTG